ncbi:colorectal mutant cancer protein [Lasius niger]|uniref:Colorectal mutant cancer protein n=1 Tax=Lasius niger TaxID=67767 RepID=A0A0J7NL47_LASNI|nr:colorectal mutant cancer protein [Lasius niger]
MFSGHVSALAVKEAVLEPPPRRGDLVYVHCATAEDEAAEDEEEEPRGIIRSRSWLCCPGDRRSDKTVPIQVEADNKDKQNAVSFSPRIRRLDLILRDLQRMRGRITEGIRIGK